MNGIIVALDFPDLDQAIAIARPLVGEVAGFKVGLELITGVGPKAVEEVVELGSPVFADMKLHDIPNTVEAAAGRIASAGARWVTAHASGGVTMLEAANRGMGGSGVLAVTVLTSFAEGDLDEIGIGDTLDAQLKRLAAVASAAGAEGAICAPGDVGAVKAAGPGLSVFTPGIRMSSGDRHDQKRVGTPEEAVAAGADYLVIGRPITRAPDPVAAAREISSSIGR